MRSMIRNTEMSYVRLEISGFHPFLAISRTGRAFARVREMATALHQAAGWRMHWRDKSLVMEEVTHAAWQPGLRQAIGSDTWRVSATISRIACSNSSAGCPPEMR